MLAGVKPALSVRFGNAERVPEAAIQRVADQGMNDLEAFVNQQGATPAESDPSDSGKKEKFKSFLKRAKEGVIRNKLAAASLALLAGMGIVSVDAVQDKHDAQTQVVMLNQELQDMNETRTVAEQQVQMLETQLAEASGDKTELKQALAEADAEYKQAVAAWNNERQGLIDKINQLQIDNSNHCTIVLPWSEC